MYELAADNWPLPTALSRPQQCLEARIVVQIVELRRRADLAARIAEGERVFQRLHRALVAELVLHHGGDELELGIVGRGFAGGAQRTLRRHALPEHRVVPGERDESVGIVRRLRETLLG